jgi:Rps23 Pro-64 3,4-dihydroxylase Tpa1-like proline 4-hydroxylase
MDNILNNIENIDELNLNFKKNQKLKINNFLKIQIAEAIYKQAYLEKNWILASGINKNKYEKTDNLSNQKANLLQIKNVNNSFGNDQFSYIFYRSMNATNMSYLEFTLRQSLSSPQFIETLNQITGLGLTKLTTLFLSKYKAGNFLSPHSDNGNGRLAFVLNLSKYWKPQYGGVLHFMDDNRNEIIESFVPGFNNFIIFYVPEGKGIPHFVSHVSPNVKFPRFAVTGWFY